VLAGNDPPAWRRVDNAAAALAYAARHCPRLRQLFIDDLTQGAVLKDSEGRVLQSEREIEADAPASIRKHQAFAIVPVYGLTIIPC